MECVFCHAQMNNLSQRYRMDSYEIEEIQYICPHCYHYVVVRYDGMCTWYDKNDNPVHPTHDK